jgi:hypothetical protein
MCFDCGRSLTCPYSSVRLLQPRLCIFPRLLEGQSAVCRNSTALAKGITSQTIESRDEFICMQKIQPVPTHLIHLWEDYRFMLWCGSVWRSTLEEEDEGTTPESQNNHQQLLQMSPRLLGILHAFKLVHIVDSPPSLFEARLLLNLSWPEMRMEICPLRGAIGETESGLGELILSASVPILARQFRSEFTMRDLAKSCIVRSTDIRGGKLHWKFG